MSEYGVAPTGLDITRDFCTFLAGLNREPLSADVIHAGKRGVLDWLGCALAGSADETVRILLDTQRAVSETRTSTVIGHAARLGMLEAPLINGLMGHVLDYDDTHMQGVILHASSPILPALLALSDARQVSGASLLVGYAAGFEAGVRIGQTAEQHHAGGWHLTGTLGTFAAAAASGVLLGLDATQMVHALGAAGTQAAGMQQNRGTMCKSLHAGKAAQNGLLAALLGSRGFTSSDEIIEGKKGFSRIYSKTSAPENLLFELGERWEITRNGMKPYACGVVQHALIDAMIELRKAHPFPIDDITAIELRLFPGVLAITGVNNPATGLQSKFSFSHSAAVGYLDGNAGIAQYSDGRATSPEVAALRAKVHACGDAGYRSDEAEATLVVGERRYVVKIEHASGTVANPMTDAAVESKFLSNAVPMVGRENAERLAEQVWNLDGLTDVRELLALCVPAA